MNATAITPKQLGILRHATGWDDLSPAKRRALRTMAYLPRNGYVAHEHGDNWPDLMLLLESQLVTLSHRIHGGAEAVFHVTAEGFALMLRYVGAVQP